MIKRLIYVDKLISFKDEPVIKVITGIRRCGKSTVLELYKQYLLDNGVEDKQIISINFEDMSYDFIDTAKKLHEYIIPLLIPDKMNYIILDEIQKIEDFQKAIDSLFIKSNTDIYITGSNAYMLSGELATLLSGRYIEVKMLPLSFKEYMSLYENDTNINARFTDYLKYSSFPQAAYFHNDAVKIRLYLDGIYSSVLLKDVLTRRKISDAMMLESIIRFMFDNVGNLLSTNKIANTMSSNGRLISTHTVEFYISALLESFIVYKAKRYDIKGKNYLKTNDKYYVCDIGLRYYLLGNKAGDMGYILENIVYLELIRRDFDVFVGKTGDKEVDFVAMKANQTEYYQVALTVRDENTLFRELSALDSIDDHYPKFLITLDNDLPFEYKGIRVINVIDFLLS